MKSKIKNVQLKILNLEWNEELIIFYSELSIGVFSLRWVTTTGGPELEQEGGLAFPEDKYQCDAFGNTGGKCPPHENFTHNICSFVNFFLRL